MTNKQHPALFDWATELLDAEGHVTLSAKEAHEIGARLRSMGEKIKTYEDLDEAASDVQLLRTGYAAARLEIESLQDRIKTMAEEHADELMLAHLDGRMQPAPAAAPTTQPAPQQEAPAMPSGWVSCTIEFDGSGPEEVAYGPKIMMDRLAKWLGKHFERTIAEKAAPQTSPASQGGALDTERLDWLLLHISGAEFRRIGVHYSGNASRADVDAARKQGATNDR